ncbi:MAG: radical SAM protein [Deltaproteobacteria bacterium]|nr:radical SAM protein [Deltaproteobacteria bacterium]
MKHFIAYKFNRWVYVRPIGDTLAFYDSRDKHFRYVNSMGRMIFEETRSNDSLASLCERLHRRFSNVDVAMLQRDVRTFVDRFTGVVQNIGRSFIHSFEEAEDVDSFKHATEHYIQQGKPLEVGIELTGLCNCACVHCYLPRAKFQWTPEQFAKVAADLQQENALFISLTGGEIFLNRGIWEILNISTKHFPTALLTNGTLFNDEKIHRLAKYPLECVNISIYGHSSNVHDAVTKVKGSYERTMNTVRKLKSLGVNVWGRYVLMKNNIHDFESFCVGWQREGLPYNVTYQLQNDYNNKIDVQCLRVSPTQIAHFIRTGLLKPPREKYCFAGITKCRINHQGDFYACELLPISNGNVHLDGFSRVWQKSNKRPRPTSSGCPGFGYLEHGNFKENYTYTSKILEAVNA